MINNMLSERDIILGIRDGNLEERRDQRSNKVEGASEKNEAFAKEVRMATSLKVKAGRADTDNPLALYDYSSKEGIDFSPKALLKLGKMGVSVNVDKHYGTVWFEKKND